MSDVVEAQITAAEEALGVTLLPVQRVWCNAILSGKRVVVSKGRRAGWTTAQQVADHVIRGRS